MIDVMLLKEGKLQKIQIENSLKTLQECVGGLIEIPYISQVFSENGIDIIINEEGKFIEGLRPEILLMHNGEVQDIVLGNCVFAGHDDEGETIGLTDRQIKIIEEALSDEYYIQYNKNVYCVKSVELYK